MSIKVFNADDHPLLKKVITDILVESDKIQWMGSADTGGDALKKVRALEPDIAILDIEMPQYTGLEIAKILIKEGSKTQFVLLTFHNDEVLFRSAIDAGVKGYLLKESSPSEIIKCIEVVHQGKIYANPILFQHMVTNGSKSGLLDNLTEHEIKIVKLIADKKTSPEIAQLLFITPKTVSNHRSNISKKLNLQGQQNGLLKWAMEHRNELINL